MKIFSDFDSDRSFLFAKYTMKSRDFVTSPDVNNFFTYKFYMLVEEKHGHLP